MKNLIVALITIVIIDPYKYLDYDRANLYIIYKGKRVQVIINEGNQCLERHGCYEAEGSNKSQTKQLSLPELFNLFNRFDYWHQIITVIT